MSIERDPHPPREQLMAFDAGLLGPAERAAIERHLAVCPLCGRVLDALPEDPFVALVRASAAAEATLSSVPDALARHPRYRVLEDFAVRLAVYLDGGKRRLVLQWFKGRTLEGRGHCRSAAHRWLRRTSSRAARSWCSPTCAPTTTARCSSRVTRPPSWWKPSRLEGKRVPAEAGGCKPPFRPCPDP